jgi:hypothetical protein
MASITSDPAGALRTVRNVWLATVRVVIASILSCVATSVSAGSIFITGHDPDFHAQSDSSENPAGARNITAAAISFVMDPAANPFVAGGVTKFLFVESKIDPPSGHRRGVDGIIVSGFALDTDFEHHDASTVGAQLDLLGTKYAAIVVASDFGGLLTQAELDVLNARASTIIAFLNSGGGLYAMAESNDGAGLTPNGNRFGFLPFVVTSIDFTALESGIQLSAFGASLGLTDGDVNGNFFHHVFTDSFGLEVVDRDAEQKIVSLAGRRLIEATGLDHFLCYATKPTRGSRCSADAPRNAGAACNDEADCGGIPEGDESQEATDFCRPNEFLRGVRLRLERAAGDRVVEVTRPVALCNPADKNGEGLESGLYHLEAYRIREEKVCSDSGAACRRDSECGTGATCQPARLPGARGVVVENQFGRLSVDTSRTERLLLGSVIGIGGLPAELDPSQRTAFQCQTIMRVTPRTSPFPRGLRVSVLDDFNQPAVYDVVRPLQLCAPVKTPGGAGPGSEELTCYQVRRATRVCSAGAGTNAGGVCEDETDCGGTRGRTRFCGRQDDHEVVSGIQVVSELGGELVDTVTEDQLCVPSTVLP